MDPVKLIIEKALVTMMTVEPASSDLDTLFEKLKSDRQVDHSDIEAQIWEIWCSHSEIAAERSMATVLSLADAGELKAASEEADRLVDGWPNWAEAWNKRATVRFIEGRETESGTDIIETLAREPRHFGAISGLGQICLNVGDGPSALMCFEKLLVINPQSDIAQQVVKAIKEQSPDYLH